MESKISSMQGVIEKKDKEIREWVAKTTDADRVNCIVMQALEERLTREVGKVVFEARIQIIEDYQAGRHLEWNLEDEKATLKRIIDEEAGEVNSKPQDVEQVGDNQDDATP
ncbi:hypothetical protein OROHE_016860 [Orobanche hederae]